MDEDIGDVVDVLLLMMNNHKNLISMFPVPPPGGVYDPLQTVSRAGPEEEAGQELTSCFTV